MMPAKQLHSSPAFNCAETAHPHSLYIKRTKTPNTHSQGKPTVTYRTTQCEDEDLPVYYVHVCNNWAHTSNSLLPHTCVLILLPPKNGGHSLWTSSRKSSRRESLLQHSRHLTLSGLESSITTDVSRELMAFGMRADMKRRRWCAPNSSSEHCSCTPEAMLVNKGGK